MSKYQFLDRRVPIEDGNIALVQDLTKCKNCSLCRKACAVDMGVFDYYDLTTNGDHPICIHCGQCASICPFDSIDEVKAAIADPNKIVIFQTAPAVRVGLGEEFGLDAGTFVEGKMVAALRKLGGDYILDTNFGADMTIMEEASELLERVINSSHLVVLLGLSLRKHSIQNSCQTYLRLRARLLCKRLHKKHILLKKWALMQNKSLPLQ